MKRLAAIAVAVVLAGCGGDTIDDGDLEDEIARDAAGEGLVLDPVDCPSPDIEEGETFTCAVTVKGKESELDVVQRDDEGNVTYDFGELKLEDEITRDATGNGLALDAVDCPSLGSEDAESFTCILTVKGEESRLRIERDDDGNLTYDFEKLVEGPATSDEAADKASVRSVISAVNRDVTAICDYATPEFRDEIVRGENCAKVVLSKYDEPLENYAISIDGDEAAVSSDSRTLNLERQRNGSWLITDIR